MSFGVDRRTFLKTGAATAAAAAVLKPSQAEAARQLDLSCPPALTALAGDRVLHRYVDLYQAPTAQNEWGYAQATKSVSGITAVSFPPFGCCGVPEISWSPGFLLTCELFLNSRILMSYAPPADQVAFQWFPHKIVREADVEGLRFTTEMFMPPKQRAVAESIRVKNLTAERRAFTLGFDLRAAVAKKAKAWFTNSPGEGDNQITWLPDRGCIVFEAQHSPAVSVQGVKPNASGVAHGRMLVYEVSLRPGETREFHYLNIVGGDRTAAIAAYEAGQANFAALEKENQTAFNALVRAAFTPGNSQFSGHLPQLVTKSESLWKLYHTGLTNLLFARRASPDSAYGTTYITLGGHVLPTLSFPWDTSLSALGLALLDPEALRRLTETWFVQDMHQHLATDYVSGEGVGPWYAVNDMAILRCARDYLRVTGDFAWLDKRIGDRAVLDHLTEHALYWKKLDKYGHGLGDYGLLENLLEVVSTYLHEVAGMNAGNVAGMRFVAALLERRGDTARAAQLRAEAKQLGERINKLLYVNGKGCWRCGQPDGTFNEVRHCYDFLSVLDNMADDLTPQQKAEMSRFFWSELHTPLWMRALSPNDVDATWNIRPDHSWLGAYCSWPPMTAKALYKTDPSAKVAAWVKGLAKAGNQGPIGQAHFVESVFAPEKGGAYKCPNDAPYINDWCCIGGAAFVDLVIDTIFGADLTLCDGLRVTSRLADFDRGAKLLNLRHQGSNYTVTSTGVRASVTIPQTKPILK